MNTERTWWNKDLAIAVLLLCVIILGSVLLEQHSPQPVSANMPGMSMPMTMPMPTAETGPGAMAPAGMTLKTFDLKPSDPVPTVAFDIVRDPVAMGGWDVHIRTQHFRFAPEHVNQAPVAGEGHAHLYVDSAMHVVYGDWYHLDDLAPGPHVITVALMANDHSIFAKDGQYIEATTTIEQ